MKALKNILIVVLVLAVLAFILSFGVVSVKTMDMSVKYVDIIKKYSKEFNSDPIIIASIIKVESDFNTDAVSHMNAKGLMQILPDTGQWISEKLDESYHDDKLHDPDYNIRLGTYYYEYLFEHFGSKELALAAYNGGMGNVEEWLKDSELSKDGQRLDKIPFGETDQYVKKVMNAYNSYKVFYKNDLPDKSDFENRFSLIWKNYKTFLSNIKNDF